MLHMLKERQRGTRPPLVLRRSLATWRAFALELSQGCEMEAVHRSGVLALDIDRVEGRYLLSGGCDRTIAVYDLEQHGASVAGYDLRLAQRRQAQAHALPPDGPLRIGSLAVTAPEHEFSVSGVKWFPLDTGMFVSAGMDGCVKVWDTNELVPVETFDEFEAVYSHCVSPSGLIAVGSDLRDILLCDLRTGGRSHRLRGHEKPVLCLQWAPDNEYVLASGSQDTRVLLWDIRRASSILCSFDQHNGEVVSSSNITTAHNAGVNGLQFSSDGRFLVTSGRDGRARLWNTATGEHCLVNYPGISNRLNKRLDFALTNGDSDVPLLFHPNGRDIGVYNLVTGGSVKTLRAHYSQIHSLLYHPFDQRLFSASNDNEILVWDPLIKTRAEEGEAAVEIARAGDAEFAAPVGAHALDVDNWSSDEA